MIKSTKLKIRIPLPESANFTGQIGDKTLNYSLYEIEEAEILENIKIDPRKKVNFNVKNGQYISRGDIIYTEGFLGHKAMISDYNGIIEINGDQCRILGQKNTIKRKINIDGRVVRYVPGRFIIIESQLVSVRPAIYFNRSKLLSEKIYLQSKKDLIQENFKFPSLNYTYFVNDNIFVDDLAKMIAFGAKRIIVNGIFVNNLHAFARELNKLDGFAVISGFGEMVSRRFIFKNDENHDLFWGKKSLFISDDIELSPHRIFEHPFWGITGKLEEKNHIVAELDKNGDKIEVYKKNIEKTRFNLN